MGPLYCFRPRWLSLQAAKAKDRLFAGGILLLYCFRPRWLSLQACQGQTRCRGGYCLPSKLNSQHNLICMQAVGAHALGTLVRLFITL